MSERDAMLSVFNEFLARPEAEREAHYEFIGDRL